MPGSTEQLQVYGWAPLDMPDHVLIDGVQGAGFQIGRAWSSEGGRFRSLPSDGYLYVLLPIEGFGIVSYDGEEIHVPQNHLILLDGAASIGVDTPRSVSRYVWRFRPELLRNTLHQRLYGAPIRVDKHAWRPVASLINSLTASDAQSNTVASPHIVHANEHLIADLIENRVRDSFAHGQEEFDAVLTHAQLLIESSHADQRLTVELLAKQIHVSERTLRRKYSRIGTTPHRELSRRRAIAAMSFLRQPGSSPREAAEQAGFSSVPQMRAALRRLSTQQNDFQLALDQHRAASQPR